MAGEYAPNPALVIFGICIVTMTERKRERAWLPLHGAGCPMLPFGGMKGGGIWAAGSLLTGETAAGAATTGVHLVGEFTHRASDPDRIGSPDGHRP